MSCASTGNISISGALALSETTACSFQPQPVAQMEQIQSYVESNIILDFVGQIVYVGSTCDMITG